MPNLTDLIGSAFSWLTRPPAFPDEWQLAKPLHITGDGWLEGEGVQLVKAHPSWFYAKLSTPHGDPLAIVAHASATKHGTAGVMAANRARARTPSDRVASWHISVESDKITQMISCEAGAWHAIGAIKGAGPANRVSVGIELVGYEKGPWPEAQVLNYARVTRALVQSYGIKRQFALVPHAVIDPDRRSDPGPDFMRNHAERVLEFAYA